MTDYPPLGDSQAAAAVCAAVFFLCLILLIRQFRLTKYRLYVIMGLSGLMRGVAFAIRASSISNGSASLSSAVVYGFFANAGFGIAIAINKLALSGWFKNTSPEFAFPHAAKVRLFIILLFPIVIILSPVLGITSALLIYSTATPDAIAAAVKLREASNTGMFIILCINLLTTLAAVIWTFVVKPVTDGKRRPHQMIALLLPAWLLLIWASAVRVATVWTHPELGTDERLYFPVELLPEMLEILYWAVPPALFARIHLSSRWDEWWVEMHPDATPEEVAAAEACRKEREAFEAQATGHMDAPVHVKADV